MRSIPNEVIAAVLKYHDIVDVVGRYVHLTKQGKNLKGLCPFHSEKTPSFTVTPEKQIFYCFGCGVGGNVIKFMMEMEGYAYPEAVRILAEEAGIRMDWVKDIPEETEEQRERNRLLEAHELSAKWFHYILKNTQPGKKAMDYLRERGISDKLIDTFQIGYAPPMRDKLVQFLSARQFSLDLMEKGGLILRRNDGEGYTDRFRDRVIFPIHNAKGQVIGFSARALGDVQPKYLNSPESILFNKSKHLYNFHQAKPTIRKTRQMVLFEGYVDVIRAWEAGIHNGVATMGTAFTPEHAAIIQRYAEQVVICYDGDDAGMAAAEKALQLLEKRGLKVLVALLPNSLDPDEYIRTYGSEQFRKEVVESAVPPVKFRLLRLKRLIPPVGEDGKLNFIRSALKLIAPLSSPTEREHYLLELAEESHYSLDVLKQETYQIREQMQKVKMFGDNRANPWNNVMNDSIPRVKVPPLLPAYHNAERKLLAQMIHDRDITFYVQDKLADQFNIEEHAAIAAYLYAYFAEGNEPDASKFVTSLENDKLENIVSSILMEEPHEPNLQIIDDYIREIKKFPQQMQIEQKKEQMIRAERAGNVLEAAQIANEILALERQLKSIC